MGGMLSRSHARSTSCNTQFHNVSEKLKLHLVLTVSWKSWLLQEMTNDTVFLTSTEVYLQIYNLSKHYTVLITTRRYLHYKLGLSSWWHSWSSTGRFEYWGHSRLQSRLKRWTTLHTVEAKSLYKWSGNKIMSKIKIPYTTWQYYTGSSHSISILSRCSILSCWTSQWGIACVVRYIAINF